MSIVIEARTPVAPKPLATVIRELFTKRLHATVQDSMLDEICYRVSCLEQTAAECDPTRVRALEKDLTAEQVRVAALREHKTKLDAALQEAREEIDELNAQLETETWVDTIKRFGEYVWEFEWR